MADEVVPKVRISFAIRQDQLDWIQQRMESGYNLSKMMRIILDEYMKREKEKKEDK